MATSDELALKQMLGLEATAAGRLTDATTAAIAAMKGNPSFETAVSTIGLAVSTTVVSFRAEVRVEAAKQFSEDTGVAVTPSGTDDTARGAAAAGAYLKAWTKALPSEVIGGTFGGGGSTDTWDAAIDKAHEDAQATSGRIASYEVADAWNDEHRRNAQSVPQWKFRQRWCTQRDLFVCKKCTDMHGKYADDAGTFAVGWPPLHADCRCIIATEFIGPVEPVEQSAPPLTERDEREDEDMTFPHVIAAITGQPLGTAVRSPEPASEDMVYRSDALHVRAIRADSREVDFIASTATIDSYDEVVDVNSWDLRLYQNNPIVLWNHDRYSLPIGQAIRCEVVGDELQCTIRFASAAANPEAERIFKLVQEKVLRAVSVGFRPTEGRYEMRDGRDVYVLYGNVLREISVTPIGANPDCLAQMKAESLERADQATRDRIRSAMAARTNTTKTSSEPTAPSTPTNDSATKGATEPSMINVKTLLALLSLQESATEDDVLAKVKAMGEDRLALKSANEKAAAEAARAVAAEAKLATLESEKATLTVELTKASTDRDDATKRANEAEDKLIAVEVDALVGKKIKPTEKDDFVTLRKNSPDLFKSMVEKRADMVLTERVTTPDTKDAAAITIGDDKTGDYFAKL